MNHQTMFKAFLCIALIGAANTNVLTDNLNVLEAFDTDILQSMSTQDTFTSGDWNYMASVINTLLQTSKSSYTYIDQTLNNNFAVLSDQVNNEVQLRQTSVSNLNATLLIKINKVQAQADELRVDLTKIDDRRDKVEIDLVELVANDTRQQAEIDELKKKLANVNIVNYQSQIDAINVKINDLEKCCAELKVTVKDLQAQIDALKKKMAEVDVDLQRQIDELRKLIANISITGGSYNDTAIWNAVNDLKAKLLCAIRKLNKRLRKLQLELVEHDEQSSHSHKGKSRPHKGGSSHSRKHKSMFTKSVKASQFKWNSAKNAYVAWVCFKDQFNSDPTVLVTLASESGNPSNSVAVSASDVSDLGCNVLITNKSSSGKWVLSDDYSVSVVAYGHA